MTATGGAAAEARRGAHDRSLNGLKPAQMRTTAEVLGAIRERLRRYEKELKSR
jgi:hypothetical protein